jgi:hypothetical protein
MSSLAISRSPDLLRLRNEGFELEVRDGHLFVHSVPYLDANKEVQKGVFCCPLTLVNPELAGPPPSHVMLFIGGFPHRFDGGKITAIDVQGWSLAISAELTANFAFSNKPRGANNFDSYYDKVWHYTRILWNEVKAKATGETPLTFKLIETVDPESVFVYEDTASPRAGIGAQVAKLKPLRIAIVGLGGTGAYVLDAVAKTPVAEIHLYDDDALQQHNAFRAPGVISRAILDERLSKVDYYSQRYSELRRGIVAHNEKVTASNIDELRAFDYVFVCVDKGDVRKLIYERLEDSGVTMIDTGMDVQMTEDGLLWGVMRVTTSEPGKRDHVASRVSMSDLKRDNLYASNIQLVEMNAMNAMLAVMRWKRHCGFFYDRSAELNASFNTANNKNINSEQPT